MKVGGNGLLEDFGDEWEVGDRTEVVEVGGVGTGFLKDRCYGSRFEGSGDCSGAEGGGYDCGDKGGQRRETGSNKVSGEGVQLT